ncbi:MAG: dimethylamine methyltransferase [Firmicutes bacterium ML8_F2]|nr:MAG: dimethylamine methyltransferase [Firmicutes bacterium ML8_F2]
MGDGSGVYMSAEEIKEDILQGVKDAADRGKIPELTAEEMDYIFEIVTMPGNIVGVERGREVVNTSDSGSCKMTYHANIAMERSTSVMISEKVLGADSVDIGNMDYSYKAVKQIVHNETPVMELAQLNAVMPVLYGSMPNLGLYTKPDGPVDNWSELLPMAKIDEARAAQEEAVEHAVRDMVFVAGEMYAAGADGINLDTCGASGDADYQASLLATEQIKEKYPNLGVEFGAAGEFVLGMHGKLEYAGTRIAGLYPHKQVKLAEKAGANIFGPVVNTNTSKSFPWNLARTVTFIKACSEVAEIPLHINVGMGVGGVPMTEIPPIDAVTRADKALIEIGKADGL